MNCSTDTPSPWVALHAMHIPPGGRVLDLACGSGRHAIWLANRGYRVEAVDQDAAKMADMAETPGIRLTVADLEAAGWPFTGERFDGIVVSRYLHRPLLPHIARSLNVGGVLIYETFMTGNERYGKPGNPDFLLQPDELLAVFSPHLTILAFEQGQESTPRPAVMQRICAINLQEP